jgi:hypothetical protein
MQNHEKLALFRKNPPLRTIRTVSPADGRYPQSELASFFNLEVVDPTKKTPKNWLCFVKNQAHREPPGFRRKV